MNDQELVAVIRSLAQLLKVQIDYVHGIHRSLIAVFEVMKRNDPEIPQKYRTEMDRIQSWPAYKDTRQAIDSLLEQLDSR